MIVDSVITLENDVNCLLLEKVTYNNDNYFLSVVLNEEEEPSDEYVVFKEINEDGQSFVEKVENAALLAELINLFTNNVAKLVQELPEEL
jgi:hypothetical protein